MYSYNRTNLAKRNDTSIIIWDPGTFAKCVLFHFFVEMNANMKISVLLQTLCESNTKLIDSFITLTANKLGLRNE